VRHIFIDAGCYDGDTVREFNDWKLLAYPESTEWEVYAFDASPQFKEAWERDNSGAKFEQKAVWVEDGHTTFANCTDKHNLGSTLISGKDHWNIGERITVECFDFSQWLKQFDGCHVIVKMDIEGAEMPVLTKMIEDGTDTIPHKMFVEWHDHKIAGNTYDRNEIIKGYRGELLTWR